MKLEHADSHFGQRWIAFLLLPAIWLPLQGCDCDPETDPDADQRHKRDAARADHPVLDTAGGHDMNTGDLLPLDSTVFDLVAPDQAAPDQAAPDTGLPDVPAADSTVFDGHLHEVWVADASAPDLIRPDTAPLPDIVIFPDAWRDAGFAEDSRIDTGIADSPSYDILVEEGGVEDGSNEDALSEDAQSAEDAALHCGEDSGIDICQGLSCCSNVCVDVSNNPHHCGACDNACLGDTFCNSDPTCSPLLFDNLCQNLSVTILHDVGGVDTEEADIVGEALAASCGLTPTTTHEEDTQVLNQETSQPIAAAGNTLVIGGGNYHQQALAYLENAGVTPVYPDDDFPTMRFRARVDDRLLLEFDYNNDISSGHDYFVIQLAAEPQYGSLVLSAYGIEGNGTAAAAWYFENVVMAGTAEFWMLVEWTDDGDLTVDADDTFTVLAVSSQD